MSGHLRRLVFAALACAGFTVSGSGVGHAGPRVLGPLTISVDETVFSVVGNADDRLNLECRAADCSRFGREHPEVSVAVTPAVGTSPCGADAEDGGRATREVVRSGSVTFEVVTRRSRGRALSPDLQQACARIGQNEVVIANGFGTGCRSASDLSPARFLELVRGLQPELRRP